MIALDQLNQKISKTLEKRAFTREQPNIIFIDDHSIYSTVSSRLSTLVPDHYFPSIAQQPLHFMQVLQRTTVTAGSIQKWPRKFPFNQIVGREGFENILCHRVRWYQYSQEQDTLEAAAHSLQHFIQFK